MAGANNNFTEVQKDVVQVKTILSGIEKSVDKLTNISADVTQLLAVHENRITYSERLNNQLQGQMDKNKESTDKNFKEVVEKIDEVKDDLHDEISAQRVDILTKLDDNTKTREDQHVEIKRRMTKLERWMWTLVGGATVIFVLLDKFPAILHF